MSITLEDVAKKAGVSHTTVSLVIRNDKRITKKTRDRVMKVIKKLGYRPNYLARALAGGKTNIVAIISPFFSSPFEMNFLKGIETTEKIKNYNIIQISTKGDKSKEIDSFKTILNSKLADAVISLNVKPSNLVIREYSENNIPLIVVEEKAEKCLNIITNHYKGAYLATEYLIKKNKKDIIFISGPIYSKKTSFSDIEKFKGYEYALKKHNLNFKKENIIIIENFYFEDGIKSLDYILKNNKKFDSIFCAAGDMVAAGIIKSAKEKGLKIPDDFSLIGYDDIELASLITPSLTTIRQNVVEIGRLTFNSIIDILENEIELKNNIILNPELIIRESA